MEAIKRKDILENTINIPAEVLNGHLKKMPSRSALYITQMGYFPSNSKFNYERTGYDDYVLIYCLNGDGHFETHKSSHEILKPNQFILLSPEQYYCYQATISNPGTIYYIHVNGSMMEELQADFNLDRFEAPTDLPYNDQILDLWQEMYNSVKEGYMDENLAYANLCLYRFISFFLFPNRAQKAVEKSEKVDQLEGSIAFMKANIHKRLTADEIAHEFNYSSSHYSVLFKQKTGLSPIDYFIRIKIRYASQLLTTTDLIIKEVAEKIGYDDPFYFSRIFKKITGRSPLEYKEIYGRKASPAKMVM